MRILRLLSLSILGILFLSNPLRSWAQEENYPPPGKDPLPIIYVFNDWANQDWRNLHPEYGPLGVNWYWTWKAIEPSDDGFNWGPIDNYINQAKNHLIQLDDGRIIRKPVAIVVSPLYQINEDGIPDFVVNGCRAENPNWTKETNLWHCNYGKTRWEEFVREFGKRYDPNPFVNEIWLWLGFDSEEGNAGWHSDRSQPGYKSTDGGPIYYEWCSKQRDLFHEAFPNTFQFSQTLLHGVGRVADELAQKYPGGKSGVKNNGWQAEGGGSQEITYDGVLGGGRWAFSLLYYEKIPTGFEPGNVPWSAYNTNNPGWTYWFFAEALAAHPWHLDIQYQYLEGIQNASRLLNFDIMKFARRYLAKTVNTTPDVWYISREKRNQPVCWRESAPPNRYICYQPHAGDWEFFLYRKENAPNSATTYCINPSDCGLNNPAASHAYALPGVRKTNQNSGNIYMAFDIDDRYPPTTQTNHWRIILTFANQGNDKFSLEYINKNGQIVKKTISKGQSLGEVNGWIDYKWELDDADFSGNKLDGVDFRINCERDGDEFIHRLIVKPTRIGDLNQDEKINETDLTMLLKNWGQDSFSSFQILLDNWKTIF